MVLPKMYPKTADDLVAEAEVPTNGIVMLTSDEQPWKAPRPIDVTESSIINEVTDDKL